MAFGKLLTNKAEYNYNEEDLKNLIANDLNVDVKKLTLNIVRKEDTLLGDAHSFAPRYYYQIGVTVDHTINPNRLHEHTCLG